MDWVLDASMALAWALPDETSLQADRFLSRVSAEDVLWVPSLWWYEVANALILAERRKRRPCGFRPIKTYGVRTLFVCRSLSDKQKMIPPCTL